MPHLCTSKILSMLGGIIIIFISLHLLDLPVHVVHNFFFWFICVPIYSLFTNMAKSVVARRGMDKSDDYWRCFPPFLWLLRDVLIRMPERNGKEFTLTEFLTTEVLGGDNSDSMKAAVRKTLTQCFPTFECRALPRPSTERKVMVSVSTNLEKLDSLFNHGVDELITFVKADIKAKKVFDAAGAKCDGPTFAILVKEVTKAVNDDPQSIPALDSTWKLVIESRCRSVQERLLSEYCNTIKYRYDEASKGGPIEEVADHELEHKKSLIGIHDTLWSELRKQLNDELGPLLTLKVTGECSLEMVTDQLEKQLIQTLWETDPSKQDRVKKVVGGALLPIADENRKRSWEFCNQLFTKLYTPIREQVQMTGGEDGYTPDKLAADIKALVQEYDAKSVGPEKWKVYAAMETTIKQTKGLFQKHLHEVIEYTKKEREAKEMFENLRNELRELKEKREQIKEKFDDFVKQQQEVKLKEAKRKEKAEQDIDYLKAQIKEVEQKLKEKDQEKDEQKAEADKKIKMVETLREKEKKKASSEYHEQQLIIERMKADHECMVHELRQEKEKEKKQKERVQEETRITIDHLNQLVQDEKTEKELQKKKWEKHLFEKENETSALNDRLAILCTEVKSLTEEKRLLSHKVEILSEDKRTLSRKVETLSRATGAFSRDIWRMNVK